MSGRHIIASECCLWWWRSAAELCWKKTRLKDPKKYWLTWRIKWKWFWPDMSIMLIEHETSVELFLDRNRRKWRFFEDAKEKDKSPWPEEESEEEVFEDVTSQSKSLPCLSQKGKQWKEIFEALPVFSERLWWKSMQGRRQLQRRERRYVAVAVAMVARVATGGVWQG